MSKSKKSLSYQLFNEYIEESLQNFHEFSTDIAILQDLLGSDATTEQWAMSLAQHSLSMKNTFVQHQTQLHTLRTAFLADEIFNESIDAHDCE